MAGVLQASQSPAVITVGGDDAAGPGTDISQRLNSYHLGAADVPGGARDTRLDLPGAPPAQPPRASQTTSGVTGAAATRAAAFPVPS